MNEEVRTLGVILKSRFPLVVIETPEEPRVIRLLEQACNLESLPLFLWSAIDGTRPPSRIHAEQIAALRASAGERTAMAS